jgi:hypothetical protein
MGSGCLLILTFGFVCTTLREQYLHSVCGKLNGLHVRVLRSSEAKQYYQLGDPP